MGRYLLKRTIQAIPVLFVVSTMVFLILWLIPGDPAHVMLGFDSSPEEVAIARRQMGLDKPLPVQYVIWLNRVLHGDLGESYRGHQPVLKLIRLKVPATLELAIAGMIVTLIVSIPLGVLSAVRPGSQLDYGVSILTSAMLAIPNFWFGILLILFFALKLGWFPPSGRVSFTSNPVEALRSLALPSIVLGLSVSSVITRQIRSALLEVMHKDYIRTARAKGLKESTVILRHAVKNALIPVITVLAVYFGRLLGGAVVIETVFTWPGMGRLVVEGILNRDYAVVQGVMLITMTIVVFTNLLADLVYGFLDPRIRY